jgi:hypothetical protein
MMEDKSHANNKSQGENHDRFDEAKTDAMLVRREQW